MGEMEWTMKKTSFIGILSYFVIGCFSILCIAPLLLVGAISITQEEMIQKFGYRFIPKVVSSDAYEQIFTSNAQAKDYIGHSMVLNSYIISVLVTGIGTVLAVLITAMAGYALANNHVVYRNRLSLYFFITMIFSGGIVPWYMVSKGLGLTDNLLALIIPSLLFNPFNLFLVRNFMQGLPAELMESARIDGANDIAIAYKIYFPLAKPVLAAISLFYGIAYWNDWWNSIMLVDNKQLFPLQFMLYKIQSEISSLRMLQQLGISASQTALPTESLKMATVIVTVGPIILLFPFLQRFFIKGLVIGSVKG